MTRPALYVVLLSFVLAACGGSTTVPDEADQVAEPAVAEVAEAAETTAEEAVAVVVDITAANVAHLSSGYASFNARDAASAADGFAEDVTWTSAGQPPMQGRETVQGFFEAVFAGHSVFTLHPTRIFANDDLVVAEVVTRGVHDGEFHGMAGTGAEIGVNELHVFDYSGGEIGTAAVYVNEAAIMSQLGLMGEEIAPLAPLPEGETTVVTGDGAEAAVIDALLAAFNRHDFAACAALGADGAMTYDYFHGAAHSWVEHMASLAGMLTNFPDLAATITRTVPFGNHVFVELVVTATGAGEYHGADITGREIAIHLGELYELDDEGRIVTQYVYGNGVEVMAQLGLLEQAPESAPE